MKHLKSHSLNLSPYLTKYHPRHEDESLAKLSTKPWRHFFWGGGV